MANDFPFAGDEQPVESAQSSRKALFAVLGGVVALAVVGYFLVLPALSGGESTSTPVAGVVRKPAKKPAAKKPAAKKPTATQVYTEQIARDPFKALWFKPAPPETAPAPATGGTALPGTDVPATGGTDTGAGTGTGTGTGTGDNTASSVQVSLVKVFARQGNWYAQTRIGDEIWMPTVGQAFAGSFKLLAVGEGTATYLYGDERFTLREGQIVVK